MGYGLPLKCPKCSGNKFFGMLKIPGNKAVPCPNCGSKLVPAKPKSNRPSRIVEIRSH